MLPLICFRIVRKFFKTLIFYFILKLRPTHTHMSEVKKESERTSRCRFKTICVFGGSKFGKDGEFIKAASKLGRVLATRKTNLVYGGGSLGLKGCVASSALVGGSKVMGIVLKHLAAKNILSHTLGNELKVSNMHEKIRSLLYNANFFIVYPMVWELWKRSSILYLGLI